MNNKKKPDWAGEDLLSQFVNLMTPGSLTLKGVRKKKYTERRIAKNE